MIMELPWDQQDWRATFEGWIHNALETQELRLSGPIEQPHIRPWSTILTVPTADGLLYAKACAPTMLQEAALLPRLAQWTPEDVPALLAADPTQGWLLMRDAGITLRTCLRKTPDITHWRRILPRYAQMQQTLISQVPEMLDIGVPDRRLAVLTDRYAELLEDLPLLHLDQPSGLTSDEYRQLRELTPRIAEECAGLADYGIPDSLDHSDLHDNNLFVRGDRYIFADWGDAAVAHPFFTLLVVLRSVAARFEFAEDTPQLMSLSDTYLEQWSAHETLPELREALKRADRLSRICRALTWHRAVAPLTPEQREPYVDGVPGWLQETLAAFDRNLPK